MNSRGPLPQPDSVRGVRGTNGAASESVQEELQPPKYLKGAQKAEFIELIRQQREADVGMRHVDADSYAEYIILRADFRAARTVDDRLKIRRGMAPLAMQLCIGEYARQRVGIRGKKVQPKGKLAIMLAKKNGTTGTE